VTVAEEEVTELETGDTVESGIIALEIVLGLTVTVEELNEEVSLGT